MAILKQSTARVRVFSFVSASITSLSVTLSKNGGAFGAPHGAGLANITGNFYSVTLDSTDTATLGDLAYKFVDTILGAIAADGGHVDQVTTELPGLLSAAGLNAITATDPGAVATTFPQMVVQLWRRFFKKSTLSAAAGIKTYADDGTTVNTTQVVSDDNTTQVQGAAT